MRTVEISGKSFSKIVLGTNAIYGRSHFSTARDREYAGRNTDEAIKKLIRKCMGHGVNAVETSANERIQKIVSEIRSESNNPLHIIGNTRVDATSGMKSHREKFAFLKAQRTDICIIHSQFVDRPRRTDDIRGLQSLVDDIHDTGLIAGISTHRVSTVELCEKRDYGIDVYLFPLNKTGFVYPEYEGDESVGERIALINRVPKSFILMKTLAAGRIPPEEGLPFVLAHTKPNDIISLGLSSPGEAEESLNLILEIMA